MTIKLTATYEIISWPEPVDDSGDVEPNREGGYTDPSNPWGGFRCEMPDDVYGEDAVAWCAENVTTVEFDDACEAAQFVADFEGGVWDYSESIPDSRLDGTSMSVTLHVDGDDPNDQADVFAIARIIERRRDDGLKRMHDEYHLRDLIARANRAFRDDDEAAYEDLQEQVRNFCDSHPELTPIANDAGIYGGGPA